MISLFSLSMCLTYSCFLLTGSYRHTGYTYSTLCPWHHEPLDSPDGFPGGHYWHPHRNCHPETLPVGSWLCSGQALSVQVGISLSFSCKFHVDDKFTPMDDTKHQTHKIIIFLSYRRLCWELNANIDMLTGFQSTILNLSFNVYHVNFTLVERKSENQEHLQEWYSFF